MGKLNFWQWLGVVLLIVGIVWYILREKDQDKAKPANKPAPTPAVPTQPATAPAAGG